LNGPISTLGERTGGGLGMLGAGCTAGGGATARDGVETAGRGAGAGGVGSGGSISR
jgi:hypothetical protein